ncbi:MAG: DUF4157 domain-containing protein [Proteobacteria bacterium]|nr:DUF4157 domain-containing protein [Pseudomonadota bacterium]
MKRQTLIQTQKEIMPSQMRGLLPHAAVRANLEYDFPSNGSAETRFGHDFSQVVVRTSAPIIGQDYSNASCPLSPQRSPFGGACHTCPPRVQAKLKIGKPGDKYEQEADRVADQVMRMPKLKNSDANKYLQAKSFVQRRVSNTQSGATKVPSIVHDVLRTAGQPLDQATRGFMEPCFDHDFSQVRIHIDSKAEESANAVRAKAYTMGQDVVFGVGQYAPGTTAGNLLLAHELTHVVQQSRNSGVVGVIQRVGECRGRNGFNCNGVRCTTAAGRRGVCTWGGLKYGCNCRDTSTDEPGPSRVREMLPSWLLLLLSAAAIAAIVACFASGVCEFGLVVAGLGAAAAAAVIAILNAAGVRDIGSSGGEVA